MPRDTSMQRERIRLLTINNFKGFSNEIRIDFTKHGKNLVIYGENGWGKTSIIEALKIIFDSATREIPLTKYKNIFMNSENIQISIQTTKRRNIKLALRKKKRGKNEILVSDPSGYSQTDRIYLEALSNFTLVLTYRTLLGLELYNLKTEEEFYKFFLKDLMRSYTFPPRYERTLLQELQELERLNSELKVAIGGEVRKLKRMIKQKEKEILKDVRTIMSKLEEKWNEYIKKLTDENIEVKCSVLGLKRINFEIEWNGKSVQEIMSHLNEGKLTVIALALVLAYNRLFNRSPIKLLLLDDPLIGVDMNLRLPLLKLLREEFEQDYQIIITTFDENWFDMMKKYLDENKWRFVELVRASTDNAGTPYIFGIKHDTNDYLTLGKRYLNNGDVRAAALYTRLEFERLVINYADQNNILVPFKKELSKIPIKRIWDSLVRDIEKKASKGDKIKHIYNDVDFSRSILLNPAVHYSTKPKYENEVRFAIKTVERLKSELKKTFSNNEPYQDNRTINNNIRARDRIYPHLLTSLGIIPWINKN